MMAPANNSLVPRSSRGISGSVNLSSTLYVLNCLLPYHCFPHQSIPSRVGNGSRGQAGSVLVGRVVDHEVRSGLLVGSWVTRSGQVSVGRVVGHQVGSGQCWSGHGLPDHLGQCWSGRGSSGWVSVGHGSSGHVGSQVSVSQPGVGYHHMECFEIKCLTVARCWVVCLYVLLLKVCVQYMFARLIMNLSGAYWPLFVYETLRMHKVWYTARPSSLCFPYYTYYVYVHLMGLWVGWCLVLAILTVSISICLMAPIRSAQLLFWGYH